MHQTQLNVLENILHNSVKKSRACKMYYTSLFYKYHAEVGFVKRFEQFCYRALKYSL